MPSAIIYLDESGDLGWLLDKPYRSGGSSRYLTIGGLLVPTEKDHYPQRVIRDLYSKRHWSTTREKKWSSMSPGAQMAFATEARDLNLAHNDIKYLTMTVRKERVLPHIRNDANKLYNYMIKMLLLRDMARFEHVTLVPDPRSIKVESGNSLHDYLQTELWLEKNAATVLTTAPQDSEQCLGLQFTDMLSGAVCRHFEDNESAPFNIISPHAEIRRFLF
jgi:hypothetical protein